MLSMTGSLKVFLAVEPVDLRKSFDGLSLVVIEFLRRDPESGELFVFTNRQRTRIKLLYWDGTGLWVMTKRLEMGTFSWPCGVGTSADIELKPEALTLLLQGVDLKGGNMRPWYQRS
jgi:transposase